MNGPAALALAFGALTLAVGALLRWRRRRGHAAAVEQQRAQVDGAIDALPDALFRVEAGGALFPLNPQAEELAAALGGPGADVAALQLPAGATRLLEETLQGRKAAWPSELRLATALELGGRQRHLLPRGAPLPGRPAALLALLDVSELVRADQLRADLVAVASHEFQTPLTTIRMALDMLYEGAASLTGRQQDLLATALLGVEQLGVSTSEFLDLTRVEAGQLRLNQELLHVPSLVQRTVRALRPQAEEAGRELVVEWQDDAPAMIWADPVRLRAVLSNLVANALKYSPLGGEVRITGARAHSAGPPELTLLSISVTDAGEGVAPEFRERIFDRLFRIEHAQRQVGKGRQGSGIGLYLARQIVEAHRGAIRCEAGPGGRGTAMVVLLPAPARPAE